MAGGASNDIKDLNKLEGRKNPSIRYLKSYAYRIFPLVIVSDALDYLSPKYLNKILPELVRVSANGVVIFSGIFPSESFDLLVYCFAYLVCNWICLWYLFLAIFIGFNL